MYTIKKEVLETNSYENFQPYITSNTQKVQCVVKIEEAVISKDMAVGDDLEVNMLIKESINLSSDMIEIKEEPFERTEQERRSTEDNDLYVSTVSIKTEICTQSEYTYEIDKNENHRSIHFDDNVKNHNFTVSEDETDEKHAKPENKKTPRKSALNARLKLQNSSHQSDEDGEEHADLKKITRKTNSQLKRRRNTISSDRTKLEKIPRETEKDCTDSDSSYNTEESTGSNRATKNKSENSKHECNKCGKCFCSSSNLTRHALTHTGEKPKCPECPKTFFSQRGATAHAARHHPNSKPFQFENSSPSIKKLKKEVIVCDICGQELTSLSWYKIHMRTHTGERPFQCTDCPKAFVSNAALLDHKKIHVNLKPHQCEFCEKRFARKSKLKRHLDVHQRNKQFTCEICGLKLSRNDSLQNHKFNIHGISKAEELNEESSSHKCGDCGKCFYSSDALKSHLPVHLNEKLFECLVCQKTFKTQSAMKTHMEIHSTERKNICEICGRGFVVLADLRKHIKVHNDEKPYKCPICQKPFRQNFNMKIHMNIHAPRSSREQQNQFFCEACGKSFLSKLALRRHSVVHHEKQFSCTVCQRSFENNSKLIKHQKIHEGESEGTESHPGSESTLQQNIQSHLNPQENPSEKIEKKKKKYFNCSICEKSFTKNSALTKHMKTHSKVAVPEAGTGDEAVNEIIVKIEPVFLSDTPQVEDFGQGTFMPPLDCRMCSICGLELGSTGAVSNHMRTHQPPGMFNCDVCGTEFKHRRSLLRHMNLKRNNPYHH